MRRRWSLALGVVAPGWLVVGCASPPPSPEKTAAPVAQTAPETAPSARAVPAESARPVVALVEPYLVAVSEPKALVLPPPSLRGQILSPAPALPLSPTLPTETVPIAPPAEAAPSAPSQAAPSRSAPSHSGPKAAKPTIPPGVVRLLEDERARSVDEARTRLAAATARAAQTAAAAKRQWGFVKDGFVAQKTADAADAAARQAVQEQADAQKALDAAQQRQREARRDLQAAYGAVAATPGFVEASLEKPLPAYRPVPFTYRLSILGEAVGKPSVENGTLGRALPAGRNEGAAWLVRCADPSRLRIRFGTREATLVTHTLPPAQPPQRGV